MTTNAQSVDINLIITHLINAIMDKIIKSRVLLFSIALLIPSIVFSIMIYMMSMLLKGNIELSIYICTTIVVLLLITIAEQLNNNDVFSAFGKSVGVFVGIAIPLHLLYISFKDLNNNIALLGEKEKITITLIFGWSLTVFCWTYNLFKKQKENEMSNTIDSNDIINDNADLIGGWYGVDSKESCWLPVLAFEKNYIAIFSDGKIVKEYSYRICCNNSIILTNKEEKIYVKRIWVKKKPHLFYNGQAFTQDGKHSE